MDNVEATTSMLEKKKMLEKALVEIERTYGKGSIMRLGKHSVNRLIETISTGSIGLDLALGIGGLPKGRVIEIYGPEYENWHTALSSVYAIYLIADRKDGKLYVGSAFDTGGLLNRWKSFVDTKHGGNKGMKELVCNFPDRYEYFQFSILQIIPKNITAEEVIEVENLYKKKLMSIDFGMNEN
ncbi:GIY-YIG nuclease family protein [Cohnella sp. NL03-T5]|uniref:Protein RecA n=1 Tax=Cohnella silvisoli TaxID=2873699 RepID=A0ABV1L0K2_9BACL|nr:GIY-YIG nuclease family protein [Cohnella silvisoli]MCD9024678.1 GIY-YIG nuclease family protein [Cohnella silvisoli]